MKKIISLFLIVCIAIGLFPPVQSYAAAKESYTDYPSYSKLSTEQQKLIQQQFILKGTLKNIKGDMFVALKPLETHQIVVYNYPNVCTTALGVGRSFVNKGGTKEYQYLGYDIYGKLVTNDYYTNGPIVGERDPKQIPNFTYVEIPGALKSWDSVAEGTKKHMLNKPFSSLDEHDSKNPESLSMKQVLDNSIQNRSNIDEYYKRLLMQSEATAVSDGSMRTQYRGWNTQTGAPVKSYNTFTVEKMIPKSYKPLVGISVYDDLACQKPITVKDIAPGQNQVTVYVKVVTNASLDKIGLGGREAQYLESVTNTYSGKSETLTNFTTPSNMASVYPLILKRTDYKNTYTDKKVEGIGSVKSKADLIKIVAADKATAILKVRALDPAMIAPDFQIWYGSENKTDSGIQHDKDVIDKDFTFDLKDQTYLPADVKVDKYNWFALNYETNQFDDYFGWTKDSKYTITPEKAKKYFKNNTITIMQRVVDTYGRPYERTHTVSIGFKQAPPEVEKEVEPLAYVYAPGTIRAGQRCGISGEGSSANGAIVSYDFDLASSFMVIKEGMKEKEGTFLSFDHTPSDDWSETTSLTVTDAIGKTATDSTKTYVKHPIVPVFKTRGVYKVNRTIELDSTESTGTEYYPIDQVTWTIRPMDGQSISNIKTWDSSKNENGFIKVQGAKPKVDFKQLGRYEVWMDVHSTCTYPGQTSKTASKQVYGIITIAPDVPPVVKLSVPTKTIRDYEDAQRATITIWDESYSIDGDNIGKRRYYVRYDSNNNKRTDDEVWQMLYEGTESSFDYKTPNVGYYEFKIEVEEANESVNSPFWNPVTDVLKANSDTQPLTEKQCEVLNTAPITSIMAERKKLDLVLVTDYEGSDYSALKTELDLLTKDLFEKGVDIEVRVFKDKVRNGSVKAPLYRYARYAHVNYTTEYTRNSDIQYQTQRMDDRFTWESKVQLETDYLPTLAPIPATYTTSWYNKADPAGGVQVNQGMTVTVNAPTDPYLKSGSTSIITELVYSNQYNSGLEKRQNIRDMSVAVDNYYVKENIVDYVDIALYTMNLDLLRQTISYREGSDRQMLFVMKTGDSLTTLNQTFADYIKQNSVVVSAVNGFDMASQYGGLAVQSAEFLYSNESPGDRPTESYKQAEWYSKVNRIAEPIGIAFKTEDGKSYQIQGYKNSNYPTVLSNYTFRNYQNEIRAYAMYKRYYGEQDSYELIAGYTNGNETFQHDKTRYNQYNTSNDFSTRTYTRRGEEYERPANVSDFSSFTIRDTNQWYETKTYYYVVRYGNLYKWTIEAGKVNDTSIAGGKLEANNVEVVFTGKIIEGGDYPSNSLSNLVAFYYKDLNKTRILWETYNIWTGTYSYHPNEVWLDGNVSYVKSYPTGMTRVYPYKRGEGAVRNVYAQHSIDFIMSTGVSRRFTSIENLMSGENKVGNNAVYLLTLPDGFKAIQVPNMARRDFADAYYYWNSRIYEYRDTPTSVSSMFMSPTGDLYMSDSNWDNAGNLSLYPITQGLNIKKFNIYTQQQEGRATLYLVALTHDGKIFSGAIVNGVVLTPQNMTNIVKDPRTLAQPVVNAMSMRKLLNQSSANRISGSFAEFGNRLRADYEYLKYQTKVTLLLGETLKYDQLYYDREGDALYDSAISIQHDQNALESPLGTDPNNGQTLKNWDNKLNKTGLYRIQPKVQDSPDSNDQFADYRLWNKDDTTIEVLVHRKPIASMKLSVTPTAPFTVTARDSNSRDLDHISMVAPLRGITDVEWGIKKLYDDEWQITKGPLNTTLTKVLETGETYIVSYRVKDVEGVWSDPVTDQIVAGMNLLLDAKLKPENPTYNLSKFQTGNNVVFHELWTSYPLAHHLEIQMYDGNTPILTKVTLRKEWGNVKAEAYPERDWNDAVFNIPRGLADKTYNFIVTAYDTANVNIKKHKSFEVTTVSNSPPTVDLYDHTPKPVYEGDNVSVKIKLSDPDLDPLQLTLKVYDETNKLLATDVSTVNPSGGIYNKDITITNVSGGTYRIVAEVTDNKSAPVSDSYSFGVNALAIVGSITPNPCLAGERIKLSASTQGQGTEVTANLITVGGGVITLAPAKTISNELNTWSNTFIVPLDTNDGIYDVVFTVYRNTPNGKRSKSTTVKLVVKGNIYQLVKPRVIDSN